MRLFLIAFLLLQFGSLPEGRAASAPEEGNYEIDYEEEPDQDSSEETPEPERAPVKKGSIRGKGIGGGPAVQGSRAKNRFAPILKSETRSVYKKDGKTLDVDTD